MTFERSDSGNRIPLRVSRSHSSPELSKNEHFYNDSESEFSAPDFRRKSKSLARIDDCSNSAAPLRRQPHPFAMQALGLRPGFGNRGTRIPEWPPPDPPPLTPLNPGGLPPPGFTRTVLTPAVTAPNPPVWPPRPWWRRNGPSRPTTQVLHVALDTADTTHSPIPIRLSDQTGRGGWSSGNESQDPEATIHPRQETRIPVPQHASFNEVNRINDHESPDMNAPFITTSVQPVESMDETLDMVINIMPQAINLSHQPTRPLNLFTSSVISDSLQMATQEGETRQSVLTTAPTEDQTMLSLNSADLQPESSYQIFVVVLDTNPSAQDLTFARGESDWTLEPVTYDRFMMNVGRTYTERSSRSSEEMSVYEYERNRYNRQ